MIPFGGYLRCLLILTYFDTANMDDFLVGEVAHMIEGAHAYQSRSVRVELISWKLIFAM